MIQNLNYYNIYRGLVTSDNLNRTKAKYFRIAVKIKYSLLLLLLGLHNIHAQKPHEKDQSIKVINDNAAGAITLLVDTGFYRSNTTNCTLEEECIDRSLTSKCLVYHNDQWFNFRTSDSLVYYLLVKNQNCRDINGVQLLVIDGCICQPATYNILKCISLATQDDISLVLNKLKPNHQYIINLDGYLNDYCEFEISISTRLPDFHIKTDLQIEVKTAIQKDKIEFAWQLNDELKDLEITEFEILRRFQSEKKFSLIKKVKVERGVKGDYRPDYSTIDSVNLTGTYYYKILAISNKGEKILLSDHTFYLYVNPNLIPLDLDLKRKP